MTNLIKKNPVLLAIDIQKGFYDEDYCGGNISNKNIESISIACDFIKNNIRCNAIAPETVHAPSWQGRVQAEDNPEKAKKDFIARQPMGRLGTAEEIATLAVYLASDELEFVTGITHAIDGGMSI